MLPDADIIGLPLGVDYAAPWGHRGATHSLLFAAVVGAVIGTVTHWRTRSGLVTGLLATGVLASHSLLDTLTDGGLGCALFWPFELTRYFAPWRPIPVSPIGLNYFSPYGLVVAITEIVVFAPVLVYAIEPKRSVWFLAPIWLAVVWLLGSTDPVRESLVGFVFNEDTEYAPRFSANAFDAIAEGDSMERVREALGEPLGPVSGECWQYTKSANQRPFRMRAICFYDGRVEEIIRRWQPGP